MGKHAQAWSMDLIIGVLVFMLAVGIIYSLLIGRSKDDIAPLRIESEVVATKLADDPVVGVASGNQLNVTRLGNLTSYSYEELKRLFGVNNEFCILLRDEMGNVTFITDADGNTYTGVGSGNGELNVTCLKCPDGSGGMKNTPLACGAMVPEGCSGSC